MTTRAVTLMVWGVVAASLVAAIVLCAVKRERWLSAYALLRIALRVRIVRIVVLAGWLWLGWHFFVRADR